MIASALVDWRAFGEAVAAAFVVGVAVPILFGLVVFGAHRRSAALVVVGSLGCLAAAALGVVAMMHK